MGAVSGIAGCLGGSDGDGDSSGDEGSDGGGGDSTGTVEITFLGETYSFEDASCEGSTTFPPENEQIHYRNYDEEFEFWVERHDPAESNVVEVHISFPTGDASETIGEVEDYEGRTTADAVEFELGSGTSGTAELEPGTMNDDVDHDPDGGTVEWDISC